MSPFHRPPQSFFVMGDIVRRDIMEGQEKPVQTDDFPIDGNDRYSRAALTLHYHAPSVRVVASIFHLFINYFLAQYNKFVLSYFQADVISTLSLSSSKYSILSGYTTEIIYALLAILVAFIADGKLAWVWVLSISALWWSICVIFQDYSHNFWQILLTRISMSIGQALVKVSVVNNQSIQSTSDALAWLAYLPDCIELYELLMSADWINWLILQSMWL